MCIVSQLRCNTHAYKHRICVGIAAVVLVCNSEAYVMLTPKRTAPHSCLLFCFAVYCDLYALHRASV
jgi:hypothetical protein